MKTTTLLQSQIIYLLREELKSRKFATILHQLGVEEQCTLLPTLNEPIAECLGLDTDEAFREYDKIMNQHAIVTSTDATEITEEAKSVLCELSELLKQIR